MRLPEPANQNFVNVAISGSTTKQTFNSDLQSSGATQSVSKLGTDAGESPASVFTANGAGSILVLKGSVEIRIDIYRSAVSPAILAMLAQDMLSRIPG